MAAADGAAIAARAQGAIYPVVELAALVLGVWAWTATVGLAAVGELRLRPGRCSRSALIDFEHYILPDRLTLPLVPAGLAVAAVGRSRARSSIMSLGAALGYALFARVAWAYRRWRGREGLGGGDAKLLAAIGAWVGASGLPSVVLLASVLALAAALAARRSAAAARLRRARAVRSGARRGGMARLALRSAGVRARLRPQRTASLLDIPERREERVGTIGLVLGQRLVEAVERAVHAP